MMHLVALLTLGCPMPPRQNRLDCNIRKLAGSFCKKHAVISTPCGGETPTLCKQNGFRYYFTALTGLLFTFPSRYWFTIGDMKYLAFPGSPGWFPRDFRFPRYLSKTARSTKEFSNTGLLPSLALRSRKLLLTNPCFLDSLGQALL